MKVNGENSDGISPEVIVVVAVVVVVVVVAVVAVVAVVGLYAARRRAAPAQKSLEMRGADNFGVEVQEIQTNDVELK